MALKMLESGLNENNNSFLKNTKGNLEIKSSRSSINLSRASHSEEKEKNTYHFCSDIFSL
jgi:hypothetical protein